MENRHPSKLSVSLTALQRVASKTELDKTISDIRDRYEFDHLVFLLVQSPGHTNLYPFHCTTYPEEWTVRYIQKNYFALDPVLDICQSGILPVDWSRLDRKSPKTKQFFKEAREFSIGWHGFTVPVRGPGGQRSLFSATSNLPRQEWLKLCASSKHDLQLLSHYLHEQVLTVSGLRITSAYRKLSRREQECLQLLGRGVVPKRIAYSLQLSESAVRLYLGSARRKLDAATIYQAIARASFLEVIRI
ncbi:helix-turn-helix transcriptional regulator (plasmid) [Agrobacterium sp. rho-8.1]|jgi:DNA-binding CsgD family transcriptional regulator|nr:LuxR family transcriptional regulator [Agrobacterium sp. rho-8.1]